MKSVTSIWIRQYLIILFFIPFLSFGQRLSIGHVIIPNYSPFLGENEQVTVILNTRMSDDAKEIILDSLQFEIRKPDNSITTLIEAFTITYTETIEDTITLSGFDFSAEGNYEVITGAYYRADGEPKNHIENGPRRTGKISSPKLALPIIEDFENITKTEYYHDHHVNIPGLSSVSYFKAGPDYDGLLSLEKCSEWGFPCRGHVSGHLARLSGSLENNLIFSYDLSDYSASSHQLRFEAKLQGFALDERANIQILLRGNADQSWIEIYDWRDDPTGSNQFRTVSISDISKILLDNGQDFGMAFQLTFRTNGFNIYYPPSLQYLAIDDILIAEASQRDVAVGEVNIPPLGLVTESPEPLNVQLINRSTSEISEIPITAYITFPDGNNLEHTEVITESISPGEILNYTFQSEVIFSEVGQYQLHFSTNLIDDTYGSNNFSRFYFTGKFKPYKGELPFFADFEDAIGTPNYEVLSFEGVPGSSFYTEAVSNDASFQFDEDFGSRIYKRVANGAEISNDLIFTIDLSDQNANDYQPELSFRFWYIKSGSFKDEDDVISIRGNMDMPWLPLLDYNDLEPEIIHDVTLSNISETLTSHGQEHGETFQIRFGVSGRIDLKFDDVFLGEKVLSSKSEVSSTVSFPNPTHDYLMLVDVKSVIEMESVQLTDLLGRVIPIVIDRKSDQKIELDLRSLKKGMYFLTWLENGEFQTRKIIRY